jgi:hypothetical protein
LNYCYNLIVAPSNLATDRRCFILEILSNFLVSVMASVTSYYICKWLDR